ncbi:hypothetical protein [Brevibacillus sp. NRS-1366]|uniref:hypothetical protein n=1 Tax=Brevibacillus sp. NRS-1366 TaxID=3233899 RepID=UPI003D223C17
MEMDAKLNLILLKLEGLEKGQDSLHQEVKKINEEVTEIKQEVTEIKQEVTEIKQAVIRLEESQPQDIRALLESMAGKIDSFRYDVEFIAEKQAMQDLKINRIEKQIQS